MPLSRSHQATLTLVLVGLGFALSGVWTHHLWRPDEARVAGIASEVAGNDTKWVPTLHGKPFLDKPPLAFWCIATSLTVFGNTDAAARLPSVLFGLLGALFLGLLARDLYGSRSAGVCASALLLLTPAYWWVTHRCLVDPALGASTIATLFCLHRAFLTPERVGWFLAAALTSTIGFYAKGLLGYAFPALAAAGLILKSRDRSLIRNPRLWIAGLFALLLVLPWFFALVQQLGWEGPRRVFVDNHLQRFLPGSTSAAYHGGHVRPWHYYLPRLPLALFPSLLFLPAAWAWQRRQAEEATPTSQGSARSLWLWWFGLGLMLLTAASTKRSLYLFPILPAVVLPVAGWLGDRIESSRGLTSLERWTLRLVALGLLAGSPASVLVYVLKTRQLPPALLVVGCLTAFCVAIVASWALERGKAPQFLTGATLVLAILLASNIGAWFPWIDQERDLSPFYLRLSDHVPPDARLIAVSPDYAALGSLAFYSKRRCESEYDWEAARRIALESDRPVYLVFLSKSHRGAWGTPSLAQLSQGELQLLAKFERGRFRAVLLLGPGGSQSSPNPD